jgi:hypothetical protein
MDTQKIKSFIGNKVVFDENSGYIFGTNEGKDQGMQLIAEVRGWGAIQNLFKIKNGEIDFDTAAQFQDEMGKFIAEAIQEKIQQA